MTSHKIGHFLTPPPPSVTLVYNKVDPPMKMMSQIANHSDFQISIALKKWVKTLTRKTESTDPSLVLTDQGKLIVIYNSKISELKREKGLILSAKDPKYQHLSVTSHCCQPPLPPLSHFVTKMLTPSPPP